MRSGALSRGVLCGLLVGGTAVPEASAQPAVTPPVSSRTADAPPTFGVPIEVREIKGDARMPTAMLVNVGERAIHVFDLAVYRPGRDGRWELVGSSGTGSIAGWPPGEERRISAAGWRPDDGSVLVPLFAFFDDGAAVGRPESIEAARAAARGNRAALEAMHQVFDSYPDEVEREQLQMLIDEMALAFARAPFTPDPRGSQQFLNTINELKRLLSPSRPAGTTVEAGVAQARRRVAQALQVERRLPVLLKDRPPAISAGRP